MDNVKNDERSRILTFLQSKNLAYQCFIDTGWRNKTPMSETKSTTIHRTTQIMSVSL